MKLLICIFPIVLAYLPAAQAEQAVLWQPITSPAGSFQQKSISKAAPSEARQYRVDALQLKQLLSRAGSEARTSASEIELPVENGAIQRFSLVESPIMAPELAARYPEIKTYKIHGIDNPEASGRLSMSPRGFHAMVTSSAGTLYIDPVADNVYRSYSRKSQAHPGVFNCGVKGHNHASPAGRMLNHSASRTAGSLQVYRLAVAATAEYVSAVGNSVSAAQAEIVVAINRVNEIYERDLGIRLVLVANNNLLIDVNGTSPIAAFNDNGSELLEKNQTWIDSTLGNTEYDIGHVFSTGGGGIAAVGSVCDSTVKAQGVTGLPNPRGEAFYIDFVAHEIGHQFNADHSFNGTTDSCSGGRVQVVAFEPGSGSTIMSYAGICGDENITTNTDAMFGAGSINQIDAFTTSGAGNSCGSLVSISNPNEPTANAGNDFTIPHKTPFMLTASGSDLDNDPLTYSWDQMDAGTATTTSTLGLDLGDNSLFRSFLPRPENFRNFPALGTTLENKFDDSEVLACQTRTLNFRLTVRDGNSGIAQDDVAISVDNSSGPFAITSFNTAQTINPGSYTLTWDVAGTDQAPVNCSQVDISLLTFNASKTTYSESMLASNAANDGSTAITIPAQSSSNARLKVKCSNNIFYDITDADLAITATTPFNSSDVKVFYNSNGLVSFVTPAEVCDAGTGTGTAGNGGTTTTTTTTSSSSSSGSVDQYWLLLLLTLLGVKFKSTIRSS